MASDPKGPKNTEQSHNYLHRCDFVAMFVAADPQLQVPLPARGAKPSKRSSMELGRR